MAVRADFTMMDTAVLSHKPLPIERYLADAYSRMLRSGENTIAMRITIFRQAAVWIIVGSYAGLIAVLI